MRTINYDLSGITLEVKSDETIKKYAIGRVLNHSGMSKKPDGSYLPAPGGLYDKLIFQSDKSCNCGFLHNGKKGTCYCGVTVVDTDTYVNNYAYYECNIPWVNPIAINKFASIAFDSNPELGINPHDEPNNIMINIWGKAFWIYTSMPSSEELNDFELNELELNGSKLYLVIKPVEEDTPIKFIGLIGLYAIIEGKLNGNSLSWMKEYISKCLEICSPAKRMYSIYGDGVIAHSPITINYTSFILTQEYLDPFKVDSVAVNDIDKGIINSVDYAAACYGLEVMISLIYSDSPLKASSKASHIRNLYQRRIIKSSRTNISIAPTNDIDVVDVPFSLAYESIKIDILNKLSNSYPGESPIELYNHLDDRAVKACYSICEESCVQIERPPTLHKFNVMSYKIHLNEDITLRIPPLTMEPFNADTDGDQMSMWFITDPELAKDTLSKSSPRCFWFYEKNSNVIWNFNGSYLIGLYYCTRPNGYLPEDGKIEAFSLTEDVVDAFNDGKLEFDQIITVMGDRTTTGRELVNYIIENNLDSLIGEKEPITANNIQTVLASLYEFDDRYDKLKQLQDLSLECSTLMGTSSASAGELEQIGAPINDVEAIINSNDPESIKRQKLLNCVDEAVIERSKNIPSLQDQLVGSGKVSMKILNELTFGKVTISQNGDIKYSYDNLLEGMTEASYFEHAMTSRKISEKKQWMVSASGYMTRQLADLAMDVIYQDDKPAEPQAGALIPRSYVIGRQDVEGNIVKPNGDNSDLVRVKSSIFTEVLKIGSDVIRTDIFKYTNGGHIGIGMMTDLSEPLTQGGLELKHAGRLVSLETGEFIYYGKGGTIKEINPRNVIITEGSLDVTYVIPDKYDALQNFRVGNTVSYGDRLLIGYNERLPEWKFMQVASIIGAHVVMKRKANMTLAYAPCDGNIHYIVNEDKVFVQIGNSKPVLTDPTCIYLYGEGEKVKKFTRICTGIQDPKLLDMFGDLGEQFYIFHNQFCESWQNYENVEIIEMLFFCMLSKGKIKPVARILRNDRPLITTLNYGFCSEALNDFYGKDIGTDFLTKFILNQ